jgi:uncharacterized glyoxalase superfamily protein PhnB
MKTIYPILSYDDAPAAIDFLERAFGCERREVHEGQNGGVAHAVLSCGDVHVMLSSTNEGDPVYAQGAGKTGIYVVADDVDALFERARAAGAEVVTEPTDQEYGSRDFAVRDPEGNIWAFGTYAP